jgi:acetyl esterase
MPLHPQAKAIVDAFATNMPALGSLSPEQTRKAMSGFPRVPGPAVYQTEGRIAPGPGGAIPIRIYRPLGQGPFPALVWYHGGGWVLGDIEQADAHCRELCSQVGMVVVNVDYRLAPEHKFPAAAEDCYAATLWTAKNASYLNIDVDKIAVGGDSAGGNLAAVVALMARERREPKVAFQLLVYPVTEHSYNTGSYTQNAEGYLLTKASMVWFWDHYLRMPEDGKDWRASPLLVKDLKGLPPALVLTAEFDPLRDEGEAYAKKLKDAGVAVTASRYNGQIHGFFGMPGLDDGKKAIEEAAAALRKVFGKG